MAAIHLSDAGYQAIVTLAQERDITPDQLVESMVTRLIDLEAERETEEWLDDPEAMAVVRELREARAQGTPITGTPIEAIASDMYWEQLLADPERAAIVDELADEALADFAAGRTKPLSEVFDEL